MIIVPRSLVATLLACGLVLAGPASAGWLEVWQADQSLDLETARERALEVVQDDPFGADAVASAMWWLANLDSLRAPEALLAAVPASRDPELGFVVARIEAELRSRPPAGSLARAEVAGPFGVLSTLDLERSVVPAVAGLPPLATRWREPAEPFRVVMGTPDGFHGPPAAVSADGVYLVAWSLEVPSGFVGWLVVEAHGGYNLEVDGRAVERRRACGEVDAVANWYRVRLAAGSHRLRLEIASPDGPRVRVSLIGDHGRPPDGVELVEGVVDPPAPSQVERRDPPAVAGHLAQVRSDIGDVDDLLLAARIAAGRGDPEGERTWVEQARKLEPANPWTSLALARSLFADRVGSGLADQRVRRLTQVLAEAESIAGARLIERGLALREGRSEDAEGLLDNLLAQYPDDPRVLQQWVRAAVDRGWAREAEAELDRLETALPESNSVLELRLRVLAELERWQERRALLREMATSPAAGLRWVDELAASCELEAAAAILEQARDRVEHPDLDTRLATLASERGALSAGRAEVERARRRWGNLPVLDELALLLAGGEEAALEAAMADAMSRNPSNLQLLALAWRRGREPFYAPFAVDAREFAAAHRDLGDGADVVLLLDQAVERIFTDGSSLYYYHGVSRADTPAGVQRASVLQPLADAYLLKVRILKPDGSVVVPSELRAQNGFISLDGVEPGDLVEEEYVARVPATGASRHGHLPPYLYRFADPDRAFGLSEYILLVPPEIDLQVDGNFEGLEHTEQQWRGLRKLSWRAERVPPMAQEPFAPPPQELMPWLNYGFGVSWQDVGDIIRDRLLPLLRTSPELRAWGTSVLVGATPEAELRSLMKELVDVVEVGEVELDLRATAADAFADGRGSRLMVAAAVLAAADWRVDLVLTRPWNERGRNLRVPTLDAFPRPVLRVARDGDPIWLDVREGLDGVDRVNPLFQGADGLVLPLTAALEPVTFIERVPDFDDPELVERVDVRARVRGSGDVEVDFRMPIRGRQAEQLQERIESLPSDQAALIFRQMAGSVFPGADQVRGEIERVEGDALIRLRLVAPRACEPESGELVCRGLVLANPLVPVLASLPERRYPLVLRLPIQRQLSLEIEPPPGWRPAPRQARRLEARWGTVAETLSDRDQGRRSELHIEVPAQIVAPDDYPTFARFCQAVDELARRPPRLVPVE